MQQLQINTIGCFRRRRRCRPRSPHASTPATVAGHSWVMRAKSEHPRAYPINDILVDTRVFSCTFQSILQLLPRFKQSRATTESGVHIFVCLHKRRRCVRSDLILIEGLLFSFARGHTSGDSKDRSHLDFGGKVVEEAPNGRRRHGSLPLSLVSGDPFWR